MPVNSLKYKGNKFYGIRFLSYLISKRFTRMSIFYATVTINAIVTWHTKMPTTMRKIHVGWISLYIHFEFILWTLKLHKLQVEPSLVPCMRISMNSPCFYKHQFVNSLLTKMRIPFRNFSSKLEDAACTYLVEVPLSSSS